MTCYIHYPCNSLHVLPYAAGALRTTGLAASTTRFIRYMTEVSEFTHSVDAPPQLLVRGPVRCRDLNVFVHNLYCHVLLLVGGSVHRPAVLLITCPRPLLALPSLLHNQPRLSSADRWRFRCGKSDCHGFACRHSRSSLWS